MAFSNLVRDAPSSRVSVSVRKVMMESEVLQECTGPKDSLEKLGLMDLSDQKDRKVGTNMINHNVILHEIDF